QGRRRGEAREARPVRGVPRARRPRQDDPDRHDPQDAHRRRRGRRQHPTHRGPPGHDPARPHPLDRLHPGPGRRPRPTPARRARGASAVDIGVLVVAADDGVMPQTEEALNHARAAKTLVVVALNKIDKPGANPERVKSQLASLGLTPEEWGGQTAMLPVSGLKGTGIEELLERVFLEGEVLELKSHLEGPASGIVLEAEIQQGKGKVAHLIIQDGSLLKGDVILAGEGYGRVRSIHDDRGNALETAGPSMPVEV